MPLLDPLNAAGLRRIATGADAGLIAASGAEELSRKQKRQRASLLPDCSNVFCRTGWVHLWRSRVRPRFEGGWTCSPECTAAVIHRSVLRELRERDSLPQTPHRHKVPIGLLMLNHGFISAAQLRQALQAQREAGCGRLGAWLMRLHGISEQAVTRALAMQWNCPVLHLDGFLPERMAGVLPRLFVDAYGALPLRIAGERILYLAFEERIDQILALAIERMTGLKVECGVLPGSEFQIARRQILSAEFPRASLLEAAGEAALSRALSRHFERERPAGARLIRVHDCLWMRLWKGPALLPLHPSGETSDVIASIRN